MINDALTSAGPDFAITVETTSFATSKLDSPPLISIYYLPYENGEVQKIILYSGNYSSFK